MSNPKRRPVTIHVPAPGSPTFERLIVPDDVPRNKRTIDVAQNLAIEIRNWAETLPDEQAKSDLRHAAQLLYDVLVTGWTQVDEALMKMNIGMSYLHEWQGRGGRIGNVGP
ncbi:MAG: hypothetical protein LBE59_02080 [Nevskiaceae bacterium]|jgi:hypothetical protein|nr:hypothetical protein [Nevskiaceae bacterium]